MPLVSPSRMTIFLALHLAQFKWLQIFLGHSMKGKITPVPYEVPFPYLVCIRNVSGSVQIPGKKSMKIN